MWLVPPNPFGPSHLRASACERVWYRVSSRSSFDLPASLKCSAEGQSRPVRPQHRIDFRLVHDDKNPSMLLNRLSSRLLFTSSISTALNRRALVVMAPKQATLGYVKNPQTTLKCVDRVSFEYSL
jgi:hypothetical protein